MFIFICFCIMQDDLLRTVSTPVIIVKFIQVQQIVPKMLMKQHEGDLLNDYTFPYHPQVLTMILQILLSTPSN